MATPVVHVKYRVGESLRVVHRRGDTLGRRPHRPRRRHRALPLPPRPQAGPGGGRPPARRDHHPPSRRVGGRAVRHVRVPRPLGTGGRLRQGAARRCTLAGTRRRPHAARPRRGEGRAAARGDRGRAPRPRRRRPSRRSGAALARAARDDGTRRASLRAARPLAARHRRRGHRPRAARRGARRAAAPRPPARRSVPECEPVLIHGDANLRNALLLADGDVALLDLEDLSLGPAAADLGQLLAAGVPPPRAPAGRLRLRSPRGCAGTRRHRSSRGRRSPPSAATGRSSCAACCRNCSRARHEARAALLLPAQRRPRPPDAQLRAHGSSRRALPRRAARGRGPAEGIEPPRGVEIVALPPLGVNGGTFGSGDPRYSTERAWEVRAQRITATLHDVKPSVVLVELFPFGRAKFARELVPLLEQAKAARRHDRLQPQGHPRLHAHQPAGARRPRRPPGQRAPGPDPRPLRPAVRAPGGDVQAARGADRPDPLHRASSPATATREQTAASTSSSRRAAGASAGRCSKRRSRPPAAARCARSRAR